MDIYINIPINSLAAKLKEKGFVIKRKKNHYSGMLYVNDGRYHFMYELIDGEVFCDFHFDNKIHGIGMGADYGKKPEEYFEKYLRKEFHKLNKSFKTKRSKDDERF